MMNDFILNSYWEIYLLCNNHISIITLLFYVSHKEENE